MPNVFLWNKFLFTILRKCFFRIPYANWKFLKKSYKGFTKRYSCHLFEILLTIFKKGELSSFSKRNTEKPANELAKHLRFWKEVRKRAKHLQELFLRFFTEGKKLWMKIARSVWKICENSGKLHNQVTFIMFFKDLEIGSV